MTKYWFRGGGHIHATSVQGKIFLAVNLIILFLCSFLIQKHLFPVSSVLVPVSIWIGFSAILVILKGKFRQSKIGKKSQVICVIIIVFFFILFSLSAS